MLNPNNIAAGKTYEAMFGEQKRTVHISGRGGFSPESYCWNGTIVETGKRTCIKNAARFIREVPADLGKRPWIITLDSQRSDSEKGDPHDHSLLLSIREQETYRWITCIPSVLLEYRALCAEAIQDAVRICNGGPKGSDSRYLHLFDVDQCVASKIRIFLPFDLWDPAYATEEYFVALIQLINAARRNHQKTNGIEDDFLPNDDGQGAVYWTEKTGAVKVLWPDSGFLKSLYLQSEEDIRNFAEGLFGEYDHPFETLRKLLDTHEGEWLDPPENFVFFPSYKAIQFDSLFFGVLSTVYESDEEEGLKYFGRIVFSENKIDCPDILTWTAIENKVWLRTNDVENWDYFGPYENCTEAARKAYEQFFA